MIINVKYGHFPLNYDEDSMNSQQSKTYPPREAFEILGIGKTAGYAALRSGEIPSIRVGGSYRIPKKLLHEMLGEK